MLTALSNNGSPCYAWDVDKSDGPFFCKACSKEVVLKKGKIRLHHFAHKPPVTCSYGLGETELHHRAKKSIFESIRQNKNCSFCELEYKVNNIIPDIYAIINNHKVAIEIQRSSMTVQDVFDRTLARSKNRLAVIWIIPSISQLKIFIDDYREVSRVPKWLECIHALAFGRIYVWTGEGETVTPVHFDNCKRYIPITDFGGGYYRILKDRKTVVFSPCRYLQLSTDFHMTYRKYFSTKNYSVPECRLWHDSLKTWW